jgi:hypothetical protein
MALTSGQLTGIYISLACIALVVSTSLMLSLTLNHTVFIAIFAFCLTGVFSYFFALLVIKRDQHKNDIRFVLAEWIALYCMVLCVFIFIMSFVIPSIKKKKMDTPKFIIAQ